MSPKYFFNLYRRYFFWKTAGGIYIHVPKAAGTSINLALYGRPLGHYTAREIQSHFPDLFANSFVFSFVRNPWDRVLSAYRFARLGNTGSMGISHPEQYKGPEFESFESFVLDWLVHQNLEMADFVFKPQHSFLCSHTGDLIIDFVGRMESLERDITIVETRLGRTLIVPHSNKTGEPGNYRKAYKSNEMVDSVAKLYDQDIRLFSYQF